MKNIIFIVIILTFSCRETLKTEQEDKGQELNESENFYNFYKNFHQDSLFQMSRISFPLPGINTDEMTVEDTTYYWHQHKWIMHHEVNESQFKIERDVSDILVTEKILTEDPGFFIERKFESIDGKWFLTYYASVNL